MSTAAGSKSDSKQASKPVSYYFCGSIRGDAPNKAYYRALIAHIQTRHGPVCTAHIGSDVCEPKPITDREIYDRDLKWLSECDAIIAECTYPSLGVGYEIAYGHAILKKPTLVIFNTNPNPLSAASAGGATTGKKLSGLIAGIPDSVSCVTVGGADEAITAIDKFVSTLATVKATAK